jgi:periplasmic protein TonB
MRLVVIIAAGMILLACRNGTKQDGEPVARPATEPSASPALRGAADHRCTEPIVSVRVYARYPSQHVHLEGTYVFKVVVGSDGSAESVETIRAAHPGWASVGADAVRKWRWRPASCDGVPARSETTVTLRVSSAVSENGRR